MNTLLYIKANPKSNEESRTFTISEKFIESYKQHHPQDKIITLDLYKEGISFLNEENVKSHSSDMDPSHPSLKYAYQFRDADKYVIAAPFWNLSVPAVLKAYIDYVCVKSVTFKYTDRGPVGLCTGKRVVNITTRGGDYSSEAFAGYELGDRYLRTILGFMGITDYTTFVAEPLDVNGIDAIKIVREVADKAAEFAKTF